MALLSATRVQAQAVDLPSGTGHTTVGGAQIELLAAPLPNVELSLRGVYYNGTTEGAVVEPGAQLRLTKFLTIGPSYFELFQSATRMSPNPFDRRIRLSINTEAELGCIKFKHRSLFEYRFRDIGESWRYRPQFQIETILNIGKRRITPYLTDEPIYDSSRNRWTGNQTYVGAKMSTSRSVELSISEYHLDQFDGPDTDAVTLGLQYYFGK